MVLKGDSGEYKIYGIIAIFIIIVIVLAIFFSSNQLTEAYIADNLLDATWSEDINERESDSKLWGLEKWASYTYKNGDSMYPAYVTITSIKTLFMMSEDDLRVQTLNTINQASEQGIFIHEDTIVTGERVLSNEHKTIYIIYEGNNTLGDTIKIIGEAWNCKVSGTSIICIGFAQLTNNSETNTTYWIKIIKDKEGTFGLVDFKGEDGLIFNVKCH